MALTFDGHNIFSRPLKYTGGFFSPWVIWIVYEGILYIEPQPTPRPKVKRAGGVYYPSNYLEYKKSLIALLLEQHGKDVLFSNAPAAPIYSVELTFFFSYPKSTPKKRLLDLSPCMNKGDLDNLAKGVLDAMEQASMIKNDREIVHLDIAKYWTTGRSRIAYYLDGNLPNLDNE